MLNIEHDSFPSGVAWTVEEFLAVLRERNCIGQIAEVDQRIVGYMIYGLCKSYIDVFNFAVDPSWRFQGIGKAMIRRLLTKLSIQRRHYLLFRVRETNLAMQLFLRSNGFLCESIRHDCFEKPDEDAYQFTRFVDGVKPYRHKDPFLCRE